MIRWMFIATLTLATILAGSYSLAQVKPEQVIAGPAAPVIAKPSISVQATSVEEVEARPLKPLLGQEILINDQILGYSVSYPADWHKMTLSSSVVWFQSVDTETHVKIEVAGALPTDGLSRFIDRSLGQDILLTRQSLTIHGHPAERLQLFSDEVGGQLTRFYIQADEMIYLIAGSGEQKLIERVARSFSAPQPIAQH
jgi:hypothetical protein